MANSVEQFFNIPVMVSGAITFAVLSVNIPKQIIWLLFILVALEGNKNKMYT